MVNCWKIFLPFSLQNVFGAQHMVESVTVGLYQPGPSLNQVTHVFEKEIIDSCFVKPYSTLGQFPTPQQQILRISKSFRRIADLSKQVTATNISVRTSLNQPQFKNKCIMNDDGVAGCLNSLIYNLKSLPFKCVAR